MPYFIRFPHLSNYLKTLGNRGDAVKMSLYFLRSGKVEVQCVQWFYLFLVLYQEIHPVTFQQNNV